MKALRDIFIEELIHQAETNKKIVCLDCDVGKHTKTDYFGQAYPERFYSIGIAEQNAVGIAAGLAKGGKVPVVSSFASFICGRAWEQIRHSVVYNCMNVKIFATHSGLSAGEDGGTHQCIEDIPLMLSLPEIEVFAPAFEKECTVICAHVMNSSKPAYIRVGRNPIPLQPNYDCRVGEPIVIGKEQAKTVVISTGEVTHEFTSILLENEDVKLIHIGSLRPLHFETLNSHLRNVQKAIIVEEVSKYGGLASLLYENGLLSHIEQVISLNMNERFGQTGEIQELRQYYNLDKETIVKLINER